MTMKKRKSGFTVVELLTVLAIIALLTGLLMPAINMVRTLAKEAKQKVQITTIDMALMAFRNDDGDYPQSFWDPLNQYEWNCGAQNLSEALLGIDLLGFHPDSEFTADGPSLPIYDATDNYEMDRRRSRYLELANANAFELGQLFGATAPLDPNTFVLCDAFGRKNITIGDQIVKAGTPILYYKANTASKTMVLVNNKFRIYSANDNMPILRFGRLGDGKQHPLVFTYNFYSSDIGVLDPKVTSIEWPYRPDSYILISAGADGLYGTGDDITNYK